MKKILTLVLLAVLAIGQNAMAQQRRPIDSQHPLWLIHVDVWFKADPQKIINLIPEDIRPYTCLNLSLSCGYDTERNVYKMPQNAFQTYKSWGTVCQQNGMWFTCQPASGGHTHIQDDDMVMFEYFFKKFPNFLGWNYAEQFWGFDEAGDKSSSTQTARWALFARLVEMSHQYGGLLIVSFCGNVWSHSLNPIGEMKRNKQLLEASRKYPENILWLYKYTTSSCFYNNESVSYGPYISGLAKNYGVRYDNCGWNGALDALLGENHGRKYPGAAGIGTVMEQTCVNGGAVWDGPELTWREECMHEVSQTTVDGYQRRNWQRFSNMNGVWIDMFRKVISGTMYIPTREEVLGKTRIVVINDVNSGNDEDKYATWGDLYDGLYKQTDPFNRGNGQWMDNFCYFKSKGRYGAIPMVIDLYDDLAKKIPVQVKKSQRSSRWGTLAKKQADFNEQYPQVSTGDLYVNRFRNQLVTYSPHTYLNSKTRAEGVIPLQYNTCDQLELKYDKLSSGLVREFEDHIDLYLNNYRSDSTTQRTDTIIVYGAKSQPSYKKVNHTGVTSSAIEQYDGETGTYKLTVKHNGGVDVTITCSGTAERTATDAIVTRKLELPKQPELYRGPIIIEAEDMDFKSVARCCTDPYGQYPSVYGHAGNGFVDMGTNAAGSLRHQLNLKAGQTGDYTLLMRYTCTQKSGSMTVAVNGVKQTVSCPKTAKNEWRTVSVKATLNEGQNTLMITNSGALPMYMDQVIYQPDDVEPMKYDVTVRDAANGTVTANVSEAYEGDQIKLTVKPNDGCKLKELRLVNSVYYAWERTIAVNGDDEITFEMPHDNVTIQPVFADGSLTYRLDFSDVIAGAIPAGWRTADGGDVHEYPSTYGQGSRTMNGFSGYQGKGLYWRNTSAEYGKQSANALYLEPGTYKLTFAMAAWKGAPTYKVNILSSAGSTLKSSATLTAAPNANGSVSANLSSAKLNELEFTVTQAGKYVVQFANMSTGYTEFLLLECQLKNASATSIGSVPFSGTAAADALYDLNGRQVDAGAGKGMFILRTADGRTIKVMKK